MKQLLVLCSESNVLLLLEIFNHFVKVEFFYLEDFGVDLDDFSWVISLLNRHTHYA